MARMLAQHSVAEPASVIFSGSIGILGGMENARDASIVSYLLTFDVQVKAGV